ncbi:putative proteasome regulatory non-ATPase subunit 6 [Trypanosoma rangeli]|uniref:Putative proteasome regulatory non-ATPase subunit 6 n=1 Tax=Trypanosoma rangeli TaxID=5698 RepID=A0A422P4P2_TRYRA|nr:putative proteasome regulatory non-ATPase subunit 6 [Trypanosoma rangeli]RNF12634.1 putative proteasome regulatory non-ATPase subunit 6 [Trypanosoma rangeli]|eukprot:RNF12634.1 putative proteasome regulatory non-ATPase subunit 6 [Trypanosoma rangeli]
MEDEGYYYYDDDYGNEEGEAWEAGLENVYVTAKSMMDTMPEECAAGMRSVARDDPVGGRWSFKALKMLVRVCRRMKSYEEMLSYYDQVSSFSHNDVSKGQLQKAMTKLIDEAQRVPVEYLRRMLETTIKVTSRDMKSFGKLWFNAKLKHATLTLQANALDAVLDEMGPVLAWCKEEDQFAFKKSAQLFLAYALLLRVYSKKKDYKRMRETFFLSTSIANTIPPSRVLGGVMECGGKMYMHLRDWSSAFRAFSEAFLHYNEFGDPSKIGCLKYLVFARMLGGSTIDPFARREAKAYEDTPEIVPVAMLMRSFAANDVREFIDVMKLHRDSFDADAVLKPCLDEVLEQLRLQALVAYVEPYQCLYMERLKEVLLVDADEAERLCVRAVAEGKLNAALDDEQHILVMQREQLTDSEVEQLQALTRWSTTLLELNGDARKKLERII